MSNTFKGRGNLGAEPEVRYPVVNGQPSTVVDFRIFFDRRVRKEDDTWEDKGGFWLDVSWWGDRAANAARILHKGMRISVVGSLVLQTWADKDTGEDRQKFVLQADTVDLDLSRVETVTLRPRPDQTDSSPGEGS